VCRHSGIGLPHTAGAALDVGRGMRGERALLLAGRDGLCGRHRRDYRHHDRDAGPCGATFSAQASRPCARASSRTIARPRPEPPPLRDGSARKKRSNTFSDVAGGKPGPSSVTLIEIPGGLPGGSDAEARSQTWPPFGSTESAFRQVLKDSFGGKPIAGELQSRFTGSRAGDLNGHAWPAERLSNLAAASTRSCVASRPSGLKVRSFDASRQSPRSAVGCASSAWSRGGGARSAEAVPSASPPQTRRCWSAASKGRGAGLPASASPRPGRCSACAHRMKRSVRTFTSVAFDRQGLSVVLVGRSGRLGQAPHRTG